MPAIVIFAELCIMYVTLHSRIAEGEMFNDYYVSTSPYNYGRKGDIKVPFIATLLRRVWHHVLTGRFCTCLHIYIPSPPGIWPIQSCTMVHALRNAYERPHGCTVHVILHCWILSSICPWALPWSTADLQDRIWLWCMQFLHQFHMPHMTGENGMLDLWLFLAHEYSLHFCYELVLLLMHLSSEFPTIWM